MTARTPDTATVTSWVGDAVLAPSMHNAQPWRFRWTPDTGTLLLRMDPARSMPHSDPAGRGLHLGCGAALFNARVAAAHAGWEARVRLLPDRSDARVLAELTFVRPVEEEAPDLLYPAISRRRTNREPFTDEPVPPELRDGLSGAARAEGAHLSFPGAWHLDSVLDLIGSAEAAEALAPAVREEIARWTVGRGADESRPDGVPAYAFGPRRYDGRAPVRDFTGPLGSGNRPDARASAVFERSPCLAVLETHDDDPADWLIAGQAMERVLLQATLDGLATTLNSQALEWPELRWALRDPVSYGGHPQMVIRLGYGPEVPTTPRRPVGDVLEVE
ncbi:Acg family FMN-binding oxidoreductase [Streptomyces sp. NPDC013953]|uniref:Acg family FMN-binding oxidoreductase n=1 Tax=Streptomyces sp. NPDC013953 TaxID=3364868 RepID=UPI0036FD7F56